MKKWILLLSLMIVFLFAGCDGAGQKTVDLPTVDLSVEEIVSIDIFSGAVPSDAHKKHVTDPDDIQRIVDNLNSLEFVRVAKEKDMLAGGISILCSINYEDGTHFVISADYTLAYYQGEEFVIKEIDMQSLYDSLDYEAILVGESGLPNHTNWGRDYVVTEVDENGLLVASLENSDDLTSVGIDEDTVLLKNNEEITIDDFSAGDRVHIEHDGQMLETYPTRMVEVYEIMIIDENHNTIFPDENSSSTYL